MEILETIRIATKMIAAVLLMIAGAKECKLELTGIALILLNLD